MSAGKPGDEENEPLFTRNGGAYPAASGHDHDEADEDISAIPPVAAGNNGAYPPPRYQLKSTITSREYEYEADSDGLSAEDAGPPQLEGLMANAQSRGSIDVRATSMARRGTSDSDAGPPNPGLHVGGEDEARAGEGSLLAAVSNMANAILGAGIIGLPYAAREAGFLTGVTLLVLLGVMTDWTLRLVVINAKLSGKKTYVDIMESCFGAYGRAAVSFFQFSFAFGGMCAFAVILGDTIPHVLSGLLPGIAQTGIGSFLFSRQIVVVCTTLGISYPLSLYRDIEKLSKASALALVSMCIIVVTVVFDGPSLPTDLKGDPSARFTVISPGFFEAVGVISFAYVCHHNSLLIYGSLRTPTLDRWDKVTHISTGLSVVASLIMTISGYSVFTDKTRGNILNNFPADSLWANLARLCFGLNMMTTTPLECFVCREVFENYFFPGRPFNPKRHIIVTTCIVVSAMLISLATCDLGLVLEITGGFGATCLAYIFPAACNIKLSNDPFARSKWPAWASVAFGIVVMVLATGLSILKSGSKPHKVC